MTQTQLGNITFGALYHSTLGFDDTLRDFERLLTSSKPVAFPPHNIYKVGDNYYVELAAAGFTRAELEITVEDGYLIIRGNSLSIPDDSVEYIHKGIGTRSFTKKLKLLDTIVVKGAEYKDGILRIHLKNVIPEEKLARKIEIGEQLPSPLNKQLLTE